MAAIEIEQLSKRYADVDAVRGIDLVIGDGELFVLLGPSGCGKTSVLRMVAGLETPTAGRVRIGDTEVTGVARAGHTPAMMFQDAALYPHMTVAGNIGFPLRMAGVHRTELDDAVRRIAVRLGIADLLDRRPSRLSGGQRQRVSMARALIRGPDVLLMDEPMSHLDAKLRGELRASIAQLQHDLGITTLYVTHDQVEAMSLGSRLGVMYDGRLVQVGTPDELYRHPRDLFVATFVGTPMMNLFAADLSTDGGSCTAVTRRHAWTLPGDWSAATTHAPRPVVIGVRPQAWRFEGDGVVVDVEHIELIGDRYHIRAVLDAPPVRLGPDLDVIVDAGKTDVVIELPAAAHPEEQLWRPSHLVVDPGDVHVFDATTGVAIEPRLPQLTRATT